MILSGRLFICLEIFVYTFLVIEKVRSAATVQTLYFPNGDQTCSLDPVMADWQLQPTQSCSALNLTQTFACSQNTGMRYMKTCYDDLRRYITPPGAASTISITGKRFANRTYSADPQCQTTGLNYGQVYFLSKLSSTLQNMDMSEFVFNGTLAGVVQPVSYVSVRCFDDGTMAVKSCRDSQRKNCTSDISNNGECSVVSAGSFLGNPYYTGGCERRCPSGSRCTLTGFECLPGYYQSADLKSCLMCPEGFFSDGYGQSQCLRCPINQQSSADRTLCEKCPAGTIKPVGFDKCYDDLLMYYLFMYSPIPLPIIPSYFTFAAAGMFALLLIQAIVMLFKCCCCRGRRSSPNRKVAPAKEQNLNQPIIQQSALLQQPPEIIVQSSEPGQEQQYDDPNFVQVIDRQPQQQMDGSTPNLMVPAQELARQNMSSMENMAFELDIPALVGAQQHGISMIEVLNDRYQVLAQKVRLTPEEYDRIQQYKQYNGYEPQQPLANNNIYQ